MYKLYDMNTVSLIDKSNDEYDLICTMSTYYKAYSNPRFRIVYHNEELDMDEGYKRIDTIGQYYDYCKEYEDRKLKEMSCCDLKRQILKKK